MNRDENAARVVEARCLADLSVEEHAWLFRARVQSCKAATTKQGKPYYQLELADETRTLDAKIWSDKAEAMKNAGALPPGAIVKVIATVEEYEGKLQLKIERIKATSRAEEPDLDMSLLVDPGLALVEGLACKTLVIDIETVPAHERDDLPKSVEDALAKHVQRKDTASSADELSARIAMSMGMSPLFGKIVSIALGDGDDPNSEVHVLAVANEKFPVADPPKWLRLMSETELLRSFWALACKAEVVITFNGRNFDVPFLMGRSIALGVPARRDLLSARWALKPHLDLFEVLRQGDKAPSKLDVICWALGIESPKEDMDGSKVAPTYARGDIVKIAEYNRHDVRATAEVYRKVRDTVLRYSKDWGQ